eukprot:5245780-Amphidinium_carterae.1
MCCFCTERLKDRWTSDQTPERASPLGGGQNEVALSSPLAVGFECFYLLIPMSNEAHGDLTEMANL